VKAGPARMDALGVFGGKGGMGSLGRRGGCWLRMCGMAEGSSEKLTRGVRVRVLIALDMWESRARLLHFARMRCSCVRGGRGGAVRRSRVVTLAGGWGPREESAACAAKLSEFIRALSLDVMARWLRACGRFPLLLPPRGLRSWRQEAGIARSSTKALLKASSSWARWAAVMRVQIGLSKVDQRGQ